MAWIALTLEVDGGCADELTDALLAAGAVSADASDAYAGTPRESAQFGEPGEPGEPVWQRARIDALFDERADVTACLAAALRTAGLDPGTPAVRAAVADRDWVRATQSQFQPVQITPRMWVVPTWHTAPQPDVINLSIDPGMAFGTGTHPTTRLCLRWLDAHLPAGACVLDYGCGSGILAIAAMKLGAARASGIDIDADALLAARHNAMQNHVAVEFAHATFTAPCAADVVLANILANPLRVLAPLLAQATRAGGHVVLSGILEHQADEVRAAYREWFDMNLTQFDDGWVLLGGVRRDDAQAQS